MDKAFVEARQKAYEDDIKSKIELIKDQIKKVTWLDPKARDKYLAILDKPKLTHRDCMDLEWMHFDGLPDEDVSDETCDIADAWNTEYQKILHEIIAYFSYYVDDTYGPSDRFTRLLDSEPVHFEGDIIITDPCYTMNHDNEIGQPQYEDFLRYKNGTKYPDYVPNRGSKMYSEDWAKYNAALDAWKEEHPDDWDVCECGEHMDRLGFTKWMVRDTIYGDWSCTVYNTDTMEPIGEFCADAGLVCVLPLDELLKYNPKFDYHTEREWTTAVIKDFKGEVQFIVVRETGVWEDTTEYHKAGEIWEDFAVEVHGHGINMKTGEAINFVTKQTGL